MYEIYYYKMDSPQLIFFVCTQSSYIKSLAKTALTEYQELFFNKVNIVELYNANKDLFLALDGDISLMKKYEHSVDHIIKEERQKMVVSILGEAE